MEDRGVTESLILSAIYQDLTLVTETNLKETDFSNSRTSFYYALAKELVKNIKSLNELSVMSYISSSGLKDLYEKYGGYKSIENLQQLGDVKDFNTYVDNLKKYILVENLKEKRNFDVYKEIIYNGTKVIPADALPLMTSYEFHNMIQLFFNDLEVELDNKDLNFENLSFTEKEIKDKLEGKEIDTSHFDILIDWTDKNGEYRYVKNLSILDEILGGLQRRFGVHILGATSGGHKTTLSLNIAMSLVSTSNENVLILSNEVQSAYYKNLMMSIVCQNVFKCYSLTRKKISRNIFDTEEEKEVFIKANKFIAEKFDGKIKFLSLPTFNSDQVCAIMKREKLKNNINYIILDTFKYEGVSDKNIATELVDTSRAIDATATEYGIGVLMPMQLLVSQDKVSYLTSSALSSSKQVKEVSNSVLLMRRVRPFELNPEDKKYFLKPFKWVKGMNGGLIKRDMKIINTARNESDRSKRYDKDVIDVSKQHIILRVEKNRNGKSDDLILYEIDENSGVLREKCRCDYIYNGMLAD